MIKSNFTSPEEFVNLVDEYFLKTPDQEITITGLCLHLGFSSRRSIHRQAEKEEYKAVCDWARLRIEHINEKRVHTSKNPAGPIFVLKNMGWRDERTPEPLKVQIIDWTK